MKVAVSTDNGYVSAHFGRCPSYTIVDVKDGKITHREEIPNPGHQPGFLPQYLAERGVNTIIAGGMGPRAQGLFAQNNIAIIIGIQGPVDDVLGMFIKNELKPGEDLCDQQHGEGHTCGDEHQEQQEHHEQNSVDWKSAKICVTAQGGDLDAEVDPRFGRAQYFLFLNPVAMNIEAVENPYKDAAHGAGIQAAQLLADKGVGVLLTGQLGPKAANVLNSAGIQTITGISGKVKAAIHNYDKGND
jgi:predicted Fe-Mo cluster-binding NifX family protein